MAFQPGWTAWVFLWRPRWHQARSSSVRLTLTHWAPGHPQLQASNLLGPPAPSLPQSHSAPDRASALTSPSLELRACFLELGSSRQNHGLYPLLVTLGSVPCPSTTWDPTPSYSLRSTGNLTGLRGPWGIQKLPKGWRAEVEVATLGNQNSRAGMPHPPTATCAITMASKCIFIVSLSL